MLETPTNSPSERSEAVLSPEIVRKVADRVFALLQADLKRERERLRTRANPWNRKKDR